jgi:hypothetical protein
MANFDSELDPRRWMKSLQLPSAHASKKAKVETVSSGKQTMMARISGLFHGQKGDIVPMIPTASRFSPPRQPGRVDLPGELGRKSFDVPRCRSAMVAGQTVENPPMEITVALQRLGGKVALVFFWKDADAPSETRKKTEFTEEESYVRSIFKLVTTEVYAPRKIAEEIIRARLRCASEADGVLKALVEMETKPGWQYAYRKPGG